MAHNTAARTCRHTAPSGGCHHLRLRAAV